MSLTPSTKGSFLAGIGLWCLIWASLFKADEIAQAGGFQHWVSSDRCLRWIRNHKSTPLIGTEPCNYAHTGLDPLGVTFALGGTLVNVLVIYLLLPMLEKAKRGGTALNRESGGSDAALFISTANDALRNSDFQQQTERIFYVEPATRRKYARVDRASHRLWPLLI